MPTFRNVILLFFKPQGEEGFFSFSADRVFYKLHRQIRKNAPAGVYDFFLLKVFFESYCFVILKKLFNLYLSNAQEKEENNLRKIKHLVTILLHIKSNMVDFQKIHEQITEKLNKLEGFSYHIIVTKSRWMLEKVRSLHLEGASIEELKNKYCEFRICGSRIRWVCGHDKNREDIFNALKKNLDQIEKLGYYCYLIKVPSEKPPQTLTIEQVKNLFDRFYCSFLWQLLEGDKEGEDALLEEFVHYFFCGR